MRIAPSLALVSLFFACHSPERETPANNPVEAAASVASADMPTSLAALAASAMASATIDFAGDAAPVVHVDAGAHLSADQQAHLLQQLESQQMAILAVLNGDGGRSPNALNLADIPPVDLSDHFDGGLHLGTGGPLVGHRGGLADLKPSTRDH